MLDVNYLKNNGVDVDKSLELFGDMNTYNDTFQDFLDGIEEKLQNLKKFKEQLDMPNYAIYAHSIKSDARYLGFTDLAKIALDHEMAGKENNESFVLKYYDELVVATNKAVDIAKNYLNSENNNIEVKQESNIFENQPVNKEEVLVIADDSKLVTNFVANALQNKYKILPAYDGKEVIDIINNPHYTIKGLLLDLNMPNVGGFEVLEYLHNNNLLNIIPTSIITGEDSKDMINKAFQYKIIDMLVKPFSNQDVVKVVEKTVNFSNN